MKRKEDLITHIENLIDEKMESIIGKPDYSSGYIPFLDRFMVSYQDGDLESSSEIADQVAEFVNNSLERDIVRVGNYTPAQFWLIYNTK
jgi:hypothetical protein